MVQNILGPEHQHLYPKILHLVMADGAYEEGGYKHIPWSLCAPAHPCIYPIISQAVQCIKSHGYRRRASVKVNVAVLLVSVQLV